MMDSKKFAQYWASKLFEGGLESTGLEGLVSPPTKGEDDFEGIIEEVTGSNFQKVAFVNQVASISETNPGVTGREIAIELFRLGYSNNSVQAHAFHVISQIKKMTGAQDVEDPYTSALERNMNAVFLVCNGPANDFQPFKNYITVQGSERISRSFPHQDEYFCNQALGTAFLVKKYADNPKKGLVVTAAHVLHQVGDPATLRFVAGFYNKPDMNVLNEYVYSNTIFEFGGEEAVDSDWAILEIESKGGDLPEPIPFGSDVKDGDNTYCLGHPFGLPLKLSWDGMVFDTSLSKFRCKLLSYGGNSGSPVFNDNNEVIGILKGVDKMVDINRRDSVFHPMMYRFGRYGALCHPVNIIKEICSQPKFFTTP